MNKGSYVALSGGLAQERAMEHISSNLANVNTSGFKADRALFESYVKKSMGSTPRDGRRSDDTDYMVASGKFTDFSQGTLRMTGGNMDIALGGDGWLSVLTPNGERFFRSGTLSIDTNGLLVNSAGHPLLDKDNKVIKVDGENFTIGLDGTINEPGGDGFTELKVVSFIDNSQLKKEGNSLYSAENLEQARWSEATVHQGFLEASNVNAVSEMVKMINVQRSYQMLQKAIHSHDDMTTKLLNEVGRPS